ncbi:MAG: polyketide synthase, partial [Myxococcales bacterium]|nr:polyketide synthase [Myxococcales bacterium]
MTSRNPTSDSSDPLGLAPDGVGKPAETACSSSRVAIVGIGCRFPGGAGTPEAYWQLLHEGVDAVRRVPASRWPRRAGEDEVPRWAGLLREVDRFDPGFMEISPREAASLDPQQRLVLEVVWEALEDAALPAMALEGTRTGVYVGTSWQDYLQQLTLGGVDALDAHTLTGNLLSITAGRVAYLLGLRGPAVSVDTACSSSLVAVHLAAQSLRSGETDLAVAGGVNLLLSGLTTEALARVQALSPDGRCRTFDADANGYVRGEGAGFVVLKRLDDALADGDPVRAVLAGSAVNHDGRSMGLTAPNYLAQIELLRAALRSAGLQPDDIGYLEAHGTGTPLGDPIEVEALAEVFGGPRPEGDVCGLGSVKTNLGHLESAAGIAGLLKAVLALEHQAIPRHLHLQTLNPEIDLSHTPFVVPTDELPWPRDQRTRRAGISSFGFAGTNAHVIVEEAPAEPARAAAAAGAVLLPLSGKTPSALVALGQRLSERLSGCDDAELGDASATLGAGRSHFSHRAMVVA